MSSTFLTLKLTKNQNKFGITYISPLPQNFNTNNNIKIGLVGMSLYFERESEKSRRIRISLLEANNHSVVKSEKNTLHITYLPEGERHIEAENTYPSFISFDNRSLTYLSFQFTEFDGKEIELSSRQSCFLRLKVIEMRGPADIHLYCEEKMNSTGEILIDLAHPIILPEGYNWGMNLVSIGFHNPNIYETDGYFSITWNGASESMKLDMKNLTTETTLIMLETMLSRVSPDESKMSLHMQEDGRLAIKSNLDYPVSIEFNKSLGHRMGVDSNYNLASKVITINPKSSFVLNQPMDLKRPILTTLFVQNSCLQPSIVNQSYNNILRMLPVFSSNKYLFTKFKTEEYIDIIPSSLSTINFKFTSENTEFMPQLPNVPKEMFVHCVIKFFKI